MKKFVIYYRVSTKDQDQSGNGIEAQMRDVNNYLKTLNEPYEIIKEYRDAFTGKGLPTDRPMFNEALELCKKEKATFLTQKVDRMSRDMECIAHVMKKVEFVEAISPVSSEFEQLLKGVFAHIEVRMISKRTKQALESKKLRGEPLGGQCPAWKEGMAKGKEKKLEKKKEIYYDLLVDLRKNKFLGYREISRHFSESGIVSLLGNSFNPATIRRLCIELGVD